MKLFKTSLVIFGSLAIAFSQNLENNKSDLNTSKSGLQVKPVQIEEDYYKEMQRITEKNKLKTRKMHSGKTPIIKDRTTIHARVKYRSEESLIPKRMLKHNTSGKFSRNNQQFKSRIKGRNQLNRVEGYAPREEVVKIDSHPQYDPEILYQASGHTKSIKAISQKNDQEKWE